MVFIIVSLVHWDQGACFRPNFLSSTEMVYSRIDEKRSLSGTGADGEG